MEELEVSIKEEVVGLVKSEGKRIGLSALEDVVKFIVVPAIGMFAMSKSPAIGGIFQMLKGPILEAADKIDGEEG